MSAMLLSSIKMLPKRTLDMCQNHFLAFHLLIGHRQQEENQYKGKLNTQIFLCVGEQMQSEINQLQIRYKMERMGK